MSSQAFLRRAFVLGLVVASTQAVRADTGKPRAPRANVDVSGTVTDSTSGQPLQSAEVSVVNQGGSIIANTTTNTFGAFTIHNIAPGSYSITIRLIGFRAETKPLTVPPTASASMRVSVALVPVGTNLEAMQVTAAASVTVDTRSGDQVFKQNDYHGAPTTTTSQILQQSIVGAARAPTGEVHIRGQHAEYTYYVDGVPVPPGISGSLNELFDPEVVQSDQLPDRRVGRRVRRHDRGGRQRHDQDSGRRISTARPTALRRFVFRIDHLGPTSYQRTDAQRERQQRAMGALCLRLPSVHRHAARASRLRPRLASKIINFHNDGNDYFGFGKLQYAPSTHDVFALRRTCRTRGSPFHSTRPAARSQNDHQRDVNSFRQPRLAPSGAATRTDGQLAGSTSSRVCSRAARSLELRPRRQRRSAFVFFPDTTPYNLSENRSANIYGIKVDYAFRIRHNETEFKFGTLSSITSGHENFRSTRRAIGTPIQRRPHPGMTLACSARSLLADRMDGDSHRRPIRLRTPRRSPDAERR